MSITRLRALVQFRLGSHSLPVEQGRFVRPCLPRHLRRCDLCNTQAVGDELHYVFDCPRFGAIRAQYSNLFQDAEGSMRLFMWHKDQKAVSHCLTAILQMAQTLTQIRPHKPGWLNGRSAISQHLNTMNATGGECGQSKTDMPFIPQCPGLAQKHGGGGVPRP